MANFHTMDIQVLTDSIKELVKKATGYAEHNPRMSADTTKDSTPNVGVFRVVVIGAGVQDIKRILRYADIAIVISKPLSGGDVNQSNMDAAIELESIITTLAAYDHEDVCFPLQIEGQVTRDKGRIILAIAARVTYEITT